MKSLHLKSLSIAMGFLLLVACQRHWGEFVSWKWSYSLEELKNAPESLQVGNNWLVISGSVARDAMPTIGEPDKPGKLFVSWEVAFQDPTQVYDVELRPHYLWVMCGNRVFGTKITALVGNTTLKGICECNESAQLVVEVSIGNKTALLKSSSLPVQCYY